MSFITPPPPPPLFSLSLFSEEKVTNGSVWLQLKYGIVPLLNKTWPLCEFARYQHRHCPLMKGPFKISYNTTIPSFWPSVSVCDVESVLKEFVIHRVM